MKRFLVVCLFLGSVAVGATEPLPLDRALQAIRMSPADLRFKKDHSESGFVLPLTRLCLEQPLMLPSLAAQTRSTLVGLTNFSGVVSLAGQFLAVGDVVAGLPPLPRSDLDLPRDLPPALMVALQRFYAAANSVAPQLPPPDPATWEALVLATLSAKADRAAYAPGLFPREEKLQFQDDEIARILLGAGQRLDRVQMLNAFAQLCREVEQMIPALVRVGLETSNQFQHTIPTPLGAILVGGHGPNSYAFTNAQPLLIIDLGGDDQYTTSATNALGGISVILDLFGNDRYRAHGIGGQGAGLFGLGLLVDGQGNDTYQAEHFAQGAGVFGCGLLADLDGQDQFQADTFAQGAGVFGVGILWQRDGATQYRAAEKAQAYAGTLGVGILFDGGGHDQYSAGGKYPCRWLEGHHFSLAQGMAIGTRPFAGGGVAVLCDQAGDDRYQADVYGQGASYWYSIGLLLDGAGNDSYQAHQYAQGAGIHLSSGLLWDQAGDDTYQCHAICQGGAHDYGVGFLLEDAGSDRYRADTTAQGSAINNSLALLLDAAGDDHYTGTDPTQSQAAGHDGGRRKYGSIALLLDLAGTDAYSQGWTNNTLWTKPFHGAGLDTEAAPAQLLELGAPLPKLAPVSAFALPSASRPVEIQHPIEKLVRRAIRDWETPAEKADTEAADAELKKLGADALRYLVGRLDSPSVMVRVKAEELVDQLGTNAIPILVEAIHSAPNDEIARVGAFFLARFESATNAVPVLLPLLERPLTQTTALYTLGQLRAKEVLGAALAGVASDRESVRLRAAQALGRLGHPHAIEKLIPLLDDELFSVRYAAEAALVELGWPSRRPLQAALQEATPRARAHIRAALAQLR